MRIALISFEFPPSVAIGGIGTYAFEATKMLALAGHRLEIFASGKRGVEPAEKFGVRVHRFDVKHRQEFKSAVIPVFMARHKGLAFDVVESPEYGPEGEGIMAANPDIPLVVKLHTPTYIISRLGYEEPTFSERFRFTIGGLRRGRWARLARPAYRAELDPECLFTQNADEVAAPCHAIGKVLCHDWNLDHSKVSTFPYPFRPDPSLLYLPYPSEVKVVGFLGRLEARKGVIELAKAIPKILRKFPKLQFRFLGPSWPYKQRDMESWIRRHCNGVIDRLHFGGSVAKDKLASELGKCDVIILPSRWENFPYACWESLAAGRAVIGSSAGGIPDVIEHEVSGLFVEPNSTSSIEAAVISLVDDPEKVTRLAKAGRSRVLKILAPERILPLQIASYERAIQNKKNKSKINKTNVDHFK